MKQEEKACRNVKLIRRLSRSLRSRFAVLNPESDRDLLEASQQIPRTYYMSGSM